MPYITKDQVAAKRAALKKALPEFKLSVRNRNYSQICVTILEGPIEMTQDPRGYEQVNHFWINDHYEDRPQIKNVLNTIADICKEDQRELVYDGDYGSVPTFYVSISIGDWDRPYQVKQRKARKPKATRVAKVDKYPNGYQPKIEYYQAKLNGAIETLDMNKVEYFTKKLAYYVNRQEAVYGK